MFGFSCIAVLSLAAPSCGPGLFTTYLPCQLGAPRVGCLPPQLIATFRAGVSTDRMDAFASSLVNTKAGAKPWVGSAFSLDYSHRALLAVWGPHVTTTAENALVARLRKSHEFQSISRR